MKPARVILVDDHPALLELATRLLQDEFEIVASLTDGTALAQAVARCQPDVIVLEISLAGCKGIELAFQLKAAGCCAKLLFLTVPCDADYARAAFRAGASGYVVKARMAADLVPALREVLRGGTFVSPCPELQQLD